MGINFKNCAVLKFTRRGTPRLFYGNMLKNAGKNTVVADPINTKAVEMKGYDQQIFMLRDTGNPVFKIQLPDLLAGFLAYN